MTNTECPVKVMPDGTPLIYPFEKHYIQSIFESEIKRVEDTISRFRNGDNPVAGDLPAMIEQTYLRDIKVVYDRFMSMDEVPR